MTAHSDAAATTTTPRSRAPLSGRTRGALVGVMGIVGLMVAWELYKFLAPDAGVSIGGVVVLPRSNDIAMPHLWQMFERAGQPVTRSAGAAPLWQVVLQAGAFSLRVAAIGWLVGVVVGFLLAILMQRFRTARSAVLPWIVLSQTVPLIALAPLVKGWGNKLEFGSFQWEPWMSVAVIASYLAFFPVAVGVLRGLGSPEAVHLDLMRSFGVGWWRTLWRLRLPASVPYLIPALRLAAANAVVGAVVAEVSTGLKGGLGRMIIEFSQAGSSDPAKAWAPIFGAVLVGLAAAAVVALIGLTLRRYRYAEVS